jgi:diphthamide biosynthesis protein 2
MPPMEVTVPLPLSEHHEEELITRELTRPLETVLEDLSLSLDEVYEIDRTVDLLQQGNFHTAALQFPDDLLHNAAQISRTICTRIPAIKIYILADTTYGRSLLTIAR